MKLTQLGTETYEGLNAKALVGGHQRSHHNYFQQPVVCPSGYYTICRQKSRILTRSLFAILIFICLVYII